MDLFLNLLLRIFPLYIIILLGFIAGRFLQAQKETLASILIYIIAPIIIFHGSYTAKLSLGVISLPIIFFLLSSSIAIFVYKLSSNIWPDKTRNILSMSAGSANIGYFGLPVGIILFGEQAISIIA